MSFLAQNFSQRLTIVSLILADWQSSHNEGPIKGHLKPLNKVFRHVETLYQAGLLLVDGKRQPITDLLGTGSTLDEVSTTCQKTLLVT